MATSEGRAKPVVEQGVALSRPAGPDQNYLASVLMPTPGVGTGKNTPFQSAHSCTAFISDRRKSMPGKCSGHMHAVYSDLTTARAPPNDDQQAVQLTIVFDRFLWSLVVRSMTQVWHALSSKGSLPLYTAVDSFET